MFIQALYICIHDFLMNCFYFVASNIVIHVPLGAMLEPDMLSTRCEMLRIM